jgi:hypothetical protein
MLRTRATLISAFSALVLAGVAANAAAQADAEESPAYDVQVSDVTAKVGEPTVIRAVLKPHDGYRILKHYTNRVSKLSSLMLSRSSSRGLNRHWRVGNGSSTRDHL